MSNEQSFQIGRLMFVIAWLIFFILLFLFFYYYNQNEKASYHVQHGTVTIRADKQGHYRLEGYVNDYPVEFMIDTGATLVAIPQKLATQMNLEGRYTISMGTANGVVTGSLTRLKQLGFAGFTLHNIKAVIIPGSEDNVVLLGMNVLSQFNLSQQDKRLIIKK
ncbi:retropepsin-like aspartic protease family protein [Legionella fairfieldensis]|uniref:retropepsin-like aspartic protease family protein n=1 Tax=Legionella fairfieldensis TaxID=45064 RepID=UPI00048C72B7|nr:retropepsin-like aspartic protease [Legionella fairfieldensis]